MDAVPREQHGPKGRRHASTWARNSGGMGVCGHTYAYAYRNMSMYLSIYESIYLSMNLSIYLSVDLSIYTCVYIYI